MKLPAEQSAYGFAGAVVVGWSEAAAGDDQVGAIERIAKRRAHFVNCITDDGFVGYADADLIQFGGEKKGIGVEPVRRRPVEPMRRAVTPTSPIGTFPSYPQPSKAA